MTIPTDYNSFFALIDKLPPYVTKFILALCVFLAGMLVAKYAKLAIKKAVDKGHAEKTVGLFTANLAYGLIVAVVIATALGVMGVHTASIVAMLGATGLAIGLALQSSLSNMASGLLLIAQTPFKVGDFIEGAGVCGKVKEIRLFTTVITSPDNKKITIPNSKLTNDNIINYTGKDTRRVDMLVSVAYSSDLAFVKKTINEVLEADDRILKDPVPVVAVMKLNDNGIDIVVRPWVDNENYWAVYFAIQEAIKNKFDEVGIEIPFPQRVVHVKQG